MNGCIHSYSFSSLPRFKVFADFEEYVKCQEKVSKLYQVPAQTDLRPVSGGLLCD